MEEIIHNSKKQCFIVHKNGCSYCKKAFDELNKINICFDDYEVKDDDFEMKKKLIDLTNHKTYPQIFIKGKFIGGYNELMVLIMTNRIYDMLEICPVF